jgi:putative transposase
VEASRQFVPREVRSFEVEDVNSCWHLDFHTGSRNVLTAKGTWIKPLALCTLDDRSRLICHVQWFLDETRRTAEIGHARSACCGRRHKHCAASLKFPNSGRVLTDS